MEYRQGKATTEDLKSWLHTASSEKLKKTFRDMKAKLTSDCVLVHYDLTNKLVLARDTSLYSIGAVLSHCFKNGQERLITLRHTLSSRKRKTFLKLRRD